MLARGRGPLRPAPALAVQLRGNWRGPPRSRRVGSHRRLGRGMRARIHGPRQFGCTSAVSSTIHHPGGTCATVRLSSRVAKTCRHASQRFGPRRRTSRAWTRARRASSQVAWLTAIRLRLSRTSVRASRQSPSVASTEVRTTKGVQRSPGRTRCPSRGRGLLDQGLRSVRLGSCALTPRRIPRISHLKGRMVAAG